MSNLLVHIAVILVALATAASADIIRKWQTPDGRLHIGERPPAGSVLLKVYEFEERAPVAEQAVTGPEREALARAAADGREIIRRRGVEREAQRQRDDSYAYVDPAPAPYETSRVIVYSSGFDFFDKFGPRARDRFAPRAPLHGLRAPGKTGRSGPAPVIAPAGPTLSSPVIAPVRAMRSSSVIAPAQPVRSFGAPRCRAGSRPAPAAVF